MVTEFPEKIQLRFTKRRAFVRSVDEMPVEPFHQSDRERVVGGPKTRDHRLCAGQKEGTFEAGNSFLAEQFSAAGIACGERYQFGAEGQIADLSNLQKTVFSRSE